MSALKLLAQLRQLGVTFSVDGNELRIRRTKNALSPELRTQFARRKGGAARTLARR